MTERMPDLIVRAAAMLEKASAAADAPGIAGESGHGQSGAASQALESSPASSRPQRQRRAVTISPTSLAASGIVLPGTEFSRTVEEFRAVKRHVLANSLRARGTANADTSRILLITSAKPSDGKTFAAVNLALALAYEKDSRVLLIDADAYRQSLMQYLGLSAERGWIEVVAAGATIPHDLILQTNITNLEVLPAGQKCPEIPELMSSRHMKRLLSELVREDRDRYIIIDSLPCLTSTEPSILTALAGQTLFIVAAHRTTRSDLDASLRLLSASPNVNLVLNRAEPLLTEQFKRYGYEYGYGYGYPQ